MRVTSAVREELDEPSMESDSIGGSEPNILVDESESGRRYRVRLG